MIGFVKSRFLTLKKRDYNEKGKKIHSIDSVLDDTRAALKKAGIEVPYVLCPHSMSGIEALYWAQKYPDEVEAIKDSAKVVESNGAPQVSMLLFISNSKGTGWNESEWEQYQIDYSEKVTGGKYIKLDCPHYVHDHEYERISNEIKEFLIELEN